MKIKVSTTVVKLEKGAGKVTAALKAADGKTDTITVERVILAVGIVGNVENIGLEGAGVKVEKTHVVVNEWGETGVKGLWPSAIWSVRPGWPTRRCTRA